MFYLMLFYRFVAAAVGLRTGAEKILRKHSNSRLSILVYYPITYHRSACGLKNLKPVSLWFINRKCFGRLGLWRRVRMIRNGRRVSRRVLILIRSTYSMLRWLSKAFETILNSFSEWPKMKRWRDEYHKAVSLDWCFFKICSYMIYIYK